MWPDCTGGVATFGVGKTAPEPLQAGIAGHTLGVGKRGNAARTGERKLSVVEKAELLGGLDEHAEIRTPVDSVANRMHGFGLLVSIVAVEVAWLAAFLYAAHLFLS